MTRFNFSRQRGAVLIHVAVAMLGLLAFSALVIDYGIFWAARRQAQNSADAGALAGAMGLAYDDPTDFSDTGPAKLAARAAALANLVFGAPPDVNITTDVTFPPCPGRRRRHVRQGRRLPHRGSRQPAADVLRAAGRHRRRRT